jgi:hypothetical protein
MISDRERVSRNSRTNLTDETAKSGNPDCFDLDCGVMLPLTDPTGASPMSMDRSIIASSYRKPHSSRLSSVMTLRLPGDVRLWRLGVLFMAAVVAFAGSFTLAVRLTKAPADKALPYYSLPAIHSAPVTETPVVPDVVATAPRVAAPQIRAGVQAPRAHVAAVHVVRVAPRKPPLTQKPATQTPAPTTSAPQPACDGTVASLTQPVTSLLPGPLGGSDGVVQSVACSLP